MADEMYPIDFVLTWVDDTDPVWRKKKALYTGKMTTEGNTEVRYRDWDTLKYWFRGVEKFAPWVRNVYFVTDNQKPEWLNIDHPKLKWVKHTDFIPDEYLPTFNSNAIEWNMHRIEELSDYFVYFNDDMFVIKETVPEDFFVDGQPCDYPILGMLYADGVFSNMLFNDAELINRNFSFREALTQNWKKWVAKQSVSGLIKLLWYGRRDCLSASVNAHIHNSYKKESFRILWEREYDAVHRTCQSRQRERTNVTSWCIRDWQLLSGDFYVNKPIGKLFHTATMRYSDEAIQYLRKQKGKVICLNDTEDEKDFELHKKMIVDEFEKIFPEKSSFEL